MGGARMGARWLLGKARLWLWHVRDVVVHTRNGTRESECRKVCRVRRHSCNANGDGASSGDTRPVRERRRDAPHGHVPRKRLAAFTLYWSVARSSWDRSSKITLYSLDYQASFQSKQSGASGVCAFRTNAMKAK